MYIACILIIYIYIYIHTHTYIYIYIYMYVCMHTRLQIQGSCHPEICFLPAGRNRRREGHRSKPLGPFTVFIKGYVLMGAYRGFKGVLEGFDEGYMGLWGLPSQQERKARKA